MPEKVVWTIIVAVVMHTGSLIWFLGSRDTMLRNLISQLKDIVKRNHEEHKQIFARMDEHGQRIATVEATCRPSHGQAQ